MHFRATFGAGLCSLILFCFVGVVQAASPTPDNPSPAKTPGATFVRAYVISGNTAVSDEVLSRIAAPYAARSITDAELQNLLKKLADVYVQAGYTTTRAVLPDQNIDGGIIKIFIVEGFLERIAITGAEHVDHGYITERLQVGVTTPLNLAVLNSNLRLLMQERGIGEIRGELKPGTRLGGAILHIIVDQSTRFEGGLRVANDRAPAVGGIRGAIETSAHNLFGRGDVIDFVFGRADGLSDLDFRITSPIFNHGTDVSFRYFDAKTLLVEEQFSVLGAETKLNGIEFGLSQALLRTPKRQVSISARLNSRQSESFLNDRPFSFSPGVENGKADVKAVRLGAQWTEQGKRDYLYTRFTFSIGIGGLGATVHDDGLPDSRFESALAQVQWQHSFGPRAGDLFARADAQFASERLLPLEKFGIGGANSVRGYRRARFVRDSGWSSSLEYRLPVWRLAIPHVAVSSTDGQVSLVAFVDAGRAWNEDDPDDQPETLFAGGLGIRWDIRRTIRAELYWGGLRRDVPNRGDDIQDDGEHFLLSARTAF